MCIYTAITLELGIECQEVIFLASRLTIYYFQRLSDVCKHYGILISSDDDDMWYGQHSDVFYGDLEICLDTKAVLPTMKRSPIHPVHRRKQRTPMRSPLDSNSGRASVRRQKRPSNSILSPLTNKTFKPKVKRKPLRGKLIQRSECGQYLAMYESFITLFILYYMGHSM